MKKLRGFFAVLVTLGFIISSTLTHAGHAPMSLDEQPSHVQMTHDGMADAHTHHRASHSGDTESQQLGELAHCCSMGACGAFLSSPPMLHQDRVALTTYPVSKAVSRSFAAPPDAPPPRRIG